MGPDGSTPLECACQCGDAPLAAALLKAGAKIRPVVDDDDAAAPPKDAKKDDEEGEKEGPLLYRVAMAGHSDVAKALLAAGIYYV